MPPCHLWRLIFPYQLASMTLRLVTLEILLVLKKLKHWLLYGDGKIDHSMKKLQLLKLRTLSCFCFSFLALQPAVLPLPLCSSSELQQDPLICYSRPLSLASLYNFPQSLHVLKALMLKKIDSKLNFMI